MKGGDKEVIKMGENIYYNTTSKGLCSGGHTVLWAGDPNYEIPEGYPCACRWGVVMYVTCPTCEHKKMVIVLESELESKKSNPAMVSQNPSTS